MPDGDVAQLKDERDAAEDERDDAHAAARALADAVNEMLNTEDPDWCGLRQIRWRVTPSTAVSQQWPVRIRSRTMPSVARWRAAPVCPALERTAPARDQPDQRHRHCGTRPASRPDPCGRPAARTPGSRSRRWLPSRSRAGAHRSGLTLDGQRSALAARQTSWRFAG